MKRAAIVQGLLLSLLMTFAVPAYAEVNISINIAPPAPQYEVMPVIAPGYVWAPGYWAWHGDHHVWVRGRSIVQRTGYRWEPDRWEQHDRAYRRHPGYWQRDPGYTVVKAKKEKKEKKDKHRDNRRDDDDDDGDHGRGKRGKHDR